MICELCGARIKQGKRIVFIGAVIVVCNDCAVNGRIVGEIREQTFEKRKGDKIEISPSNIFVEPEYEVVENFSYKIKSVRERKGLKQEDLARHINEPVAYVKRIESGFIPPITVIKKIEKFLGINLTKKKEIISLPKIDKSNDALTLGDVVVIRKDNSKI